MKKKSVEVIAQGDKGKGKRTRHYEITEEDFEKLKNGEKIFFYNGNEIDIYFKLNKKSISDIKGDTK